MAYLYYPCICVHVSMIRGGSEARRDSTTDPDLAALQCRSSWILSLIFWFLRPDASLVAVPAPEGRNNGINDLIDIW